MLSHAFRLCRNTATLFPSLCRTIIWNQAIAENIVDITFSFANGQSQRVKARVGDNLKETAEAYQLPIPGDCHGLSLPQKVFNTEKWASDTYEKGERCQFCHVVLTDSVIEKIPEPGIGEQMWLEKIVRNRNKNSRLACQIQVSEAMKDTTIFVPEEEKE